MGNICSVLLAIGLQIGAGRIGHRLYPCIWMIRVIALCCMLEALAIVAALLFGERQTLLQKDERRAIQRRAWVVWIVWLGMLINALILGAAVGAAFEWQYVWINALTGLFLVAPLVRFVLCWPSTNQKTGKERELSSKQFPVICGILEEAVRRTGHRRRVRMYWGEGAASCFVQLGCDGIIVSPLFLSMLSKQEFLQVLLHELSHLTDPEARREIRWRRLAARQAYVGIRTGFDPFRLAAAPLLVIAIRFGERLERYLKRVYLQRELDADARAAELGDEKYTVSAALKAECLERFSETDETAKGEQDGFCMTEENRLLQIRINTNDDAPENPVDPEWIRETKRMLEIAAKKKEKR